MPPLFYQLYFQTPGVAEPSRERDVRRTIRSLLYSGSRNVPRPGKETKTGVDVGMVLRQGGFLDRMVDPAMLPRWLS